MLEPFELENMRYRWRKWLVFDCNWKVALEAFIETYHVSVHAPGVHEVRRLPRLGRAQGKHSNIGYDAPKGMEENQAKLRIGTGADPRKSTAEMQNYTGRTPTPTPRGRSSMPRKRLVDELPEGTPADEVMQALAGLRAPRRRRARRDLADRSRRHRRPRAAPRGRSSRTSRSGTRLNNMLCYSARPYGDDPDKCIFEAAVYELFPEGRGAEDRVGLHPGRTTRAGAPCCRRTSPTWPRSSRA